MDNIARSEAPEEHKDGKPAHLFSDLRGRQQINQELPLSGEDLVHDVLGVVQEALDCQQHAWEGMGSTALEGASGVVYSKGGAGRLRAARAYNANAAARYLQVHNDDALAGGEVPYLGLVVEIPAGGIASLEGLIPECGIFMDVDVTVAISSTLATYTAVSANEHLIGVLFK